VTALPDLIVWSSRSAARIFLQTQLRHAIQDYRANPSAIAKIAARSAAIVVHALH